MRAHLLLGLLAGVALTACEGSTGKDGSEGGAGQAGQDGPDGADGSPGTDGSPGEDGAPGADGADANTQDLDGDGVVLADDCDDTDSSVGVATSWFLDADGDGFGTELVTQVTCTPGTGWVTGSGDCDDTNGAVNPDASEVCNGLDDDCDTLTDDEDDSVDLTDGADFYVDGDLDGYGDDSAATVRACTAYAGLSATPGDCEDSLDTVNPSMEEICENGVDDNCNGSLDQCGLSDRSTAEADHIVARDASRSYDYLGQEVASGDFNADGFGDLVAGAYYSDGGGSASGGAFFAYGGTTLSDSFDGSVHGSSAADYLGLSLDNAGDVNADGIEDLIVGAYGDDAAYLVYGSATGLSADVDIATVAGATFEPNRAVYQFGYEVAAAGDFNDDGFEDVVISDYGSSSYAGVVYLFTGSTSGLIGSLTAEDDRHLQVEADDSGDHLGISGGVGHGDFNGDGYTDLGLGEYGNDDSGSAYGLAYVFYGPASGERTTSSADTTLDTSTATTAPGFGVWAQGVGDLNGDGYEELAVGSSTESNYAGAAYVYFGASTGWASTVAYDSADLIVRGLASYDNAYRVSALGDLSGDGRSDFAVGATGDDTGETSAGSQAIFYGSSVSAGGSLSTADADVLITGSTSYEYVGTTATASDLTGDGYPELVVGSYGTNSYAGQVHVFIGSGW